MALLTKNKKGLTEVRNQAFGFLNRGISAFQNRLAGKLNCWINSFTRRGQQWIFWIFIALAISGIILRMALLFTRPVNSKAVKAIQLPKIHLPSTDSLTKKK